MPDGTLYYGGGKDGMGDFVCGAPPSCGSFKFYLTTGIASAQAAVSSVPVLYNTPPVVGSLQVPVVLRIMAVRIGVVSGTVVAGDILYGVASAVTFSSTTPGPAGINTFIGRGASTLAGWFTVATASAAPTILPTTGLSAGGNLAAGALMNLTDFVNGSIVLPPGASFWPFIANGAAAPALTALVTVDVIQTPMYAGY